VKGRVKSAGFNNLIQPRSDRLPKLQKQLNCSISAVTNPPINLNCEAEIWQIGVEQLSVALETNSVPVVFAQPNKLVCIHFARDDRLEATLFMLR
jgi:hypothetical protein